jgi:hypothetical protein
MPNEVINGITVASSLAKDEAVLVKVCELWLGPLQQTLT